MSDRASYENRFNLIAEYVLAKAGRVIDPERLRHESNHKIVGWWWDALTYFKPKPMYFSFEDVPKEYYVEGKSIDIRGKGTLTNYVYHNGEWVKYGTLYDEMYKG